MRLKTFCSAVSGPPFSACAKSGTWPYRPTPPSPAASAPCPGRTDSAARADRHHRNPSASPEAAAAQAAHDVLAHEFADGAAAFDALLASQLAAIADGPAKIKGVSMGMEEAAEMLAARANDGSATADGPYTPGPNPGDYRPTPPF